MLSTVAERVRSCSPTGFPPPSVSASQQLRSRLTPCGNQSLPCLSANGTDICNPPQTGFYSQFPRLWRENRAIQGSPQCSYDENPVVGKVGQADPGLTSTSTASPASAGQSRSPLLRIWPDTSAARSGKCEVLKCRLSRLRSETPSCH